MKENRMELNLDKLNEVIGGAAFQNYPDNRCGVDKDHMVYTFDSLDACASYVSSNMDKYKALPLSQKDQAVIDDLLAAGLIWPIE